MGRVLDMMIMHYLHLVDDGRSLIQIDILKKVFYELKSWYLFIVALFVFFLYSLGTYGIPNSENK